MAQRNTTREAGQRALLYGFGAKPLNEFNIAYRPGSVLFCVVLGLKPLGELIMAYRPYSVYSSSSLS